MDTRKFATPWDGWTWYEDLYLVDPAGNRYSQEMIKSSGFALELAHELTGSPLQIASLKRQLKARLNTPPPQIIVRWQGEETIIEAPKWKLKF